MIRDTPVCCVCRHRGKKSLYLTMRRRVCVCVSVCEVALKRGFRTLPSSEGSAISQPSLLSWSCIFYLSNSNGTLRQLSKIFPHFNTKSVQRHTTTVRYRVQKKFKYHYRGRSMIEISGSLIWLKKTRMELIFNPCGEFRWNLEGPVSHIHSTYLHVGAPGIFSDLLRSVRMLKRESGVRKTMGRYRTYSSL